MRTAVYVITALWVTTGASVTRAETPTLVPPTPFDINPGVVREGSPAAVQRIAPTTQPAASPETIRNASANAPRGFADLTAVDRGSGPSANEVVPASPVIEPGKSLHSLSGPLVGPGYGAAYRTVSYPPTVYPYGDSYGRPMGYTSFVIGGGRTARGVITSGVVTSGATTRGQTARGATASFGYTRGLTMGAVR